MEYTEASLLEALEKDIGHPELLFRKEYIARDGITTDTEKTYESIILPYLLDHVKELKGADIGLSPVRTVVRRASESGNRLVSSILAQGMFARGIALDMTVILTGGVRENRFSFSVIDRSGKRLTLYFMEPAGTDETPLSRMLRLWSLKKAVDPMILSKALGLPGPLRIEAAFLFTGASNERYGIAEKDEVPMARKRLSAILGVSEFYLFHGSYLTPVNPGLSSPGQLSRKELLSLVEKDSLHPEVLYRKDYIYRPGVTSDTGEPYAKVLAEWFSANRDLWIHFPHGGYRLIGGKRAEMMMKNEVFRAVRNQKVFPPFGRVLPYDLLILGSRQQQIGRPALLLYDSFKSPEGASSLLRIVETPESGDTLLGAVLRLYTHISLIDGGKLLKELKLSGDSLLEGRLLLKKGSRETDFFLRDMPYVSPLMKSMGVGIAIFDNGYEALW